MVTVTHPDFGELAPFVSLDTDTIAIRRMSDHAEVVSWMGFDGSCIESPYDKARLACLMAAAPKMLTALLAALPYLDKAAYCAPTTPSRLERRHRAKKDLDEVKAAIAAALGEGEAFRVEPT